MHSFVYIIVVIVAFDLLVIAGTAPTPPPSSVMTCSTQIPNIQLTQNKQEPCCSEEEEISTCIASTLDIPAKVGRVSLTWNATFRRPDQSRGFQGIRLNVWRNEITADCPDTCFTITYTQAVNVLTWDGPVSFILECSILYTDIGYGVDVMPMFTSEQNLRCQDLFKEDPVSDAVTITTATTSQSAPVGVSTTVTTVTMSTPLTFRHSSSDQQQTASVFVAMVILSVVVFVSMVTVAVWCMVQVSKGDVRNPSQLIRCVDARAENGRSKSRERSRSNSREREGSMEANNRLPQSSPSITSLPESFKELIMNLNKDS